MTLTSRIAVSITAALSAALDLVESAAPLTKRITQDFANGIGLNQADRVFSDTRTIAASTTEDLDLAGGSLTDALGTALTFAKIRALIIKASPLNTNNVVLFGDANSIPFLGTAATVMPIKPGGMLVLTAPDVAGIAVTAGTGDILQVANGGAGTPVTYEVIVIGTSA